MVEYGLDYSNLNQTIKSSIDYFVDGGAKKIKRYNHRAYINEIRGGLRYCKF